MEETHNNRIVGVSSDSSDETFEQKVIRNIKAGAFAVYKTPEVVGDKTMIANIEWEDPEQVDKFFAFAKSMAANIIYVAESEETDETTGQTKSGILQVGFLYQSIMHHINLEEEDEYDEEDDDEYEDEEGETEEGDEEDELSKIINSNSPKQT